MQGYESKSKGHGGWDDHPPLHYYRHSLDGFGFLIMEAPFTCCFSIIMLLTLIVSECSNVITIGFSKPSRETDSLIPHCMTADTTPEPSSVLQEEAFKPVKQHNNNKQT